MDETKNEKIKAGAPQLVCLTTTCYAARLPRCRVCSKVLQRSKQTGRGCQNKIPFLAQKKHKLNFLPCAKLTASSVASLQVKQERPAGGS